MFFFGRYTHMEKVGEKGYHRKYTKSLCGNVAVISKATSSEQSLHVEYAMHTLNISIGNKTTLNCKEMNAKPLTLLSNTVSPLLLKQFNRHSTLIVIDFVSNFQIQFTYTQFVHFSLFDCLIFAQQIFIRMQIGKSMTNFKQFYSMGMTTVNKGKIVNKL